MKTILPDEIRIMKSLSDSQFDSAFAKEVKAEARQSMRVVYFIREASRRKHWLKDYSNLAKYCAHHGVSNGDFYRKLAILNTIRDIPEVESKIIEGVLNPSTVAQINTFCRSEAKCRNAPVTIEEKRNLLCKIEGASAKTVEKTLAQISPKSAIPDKKRQIADNLFSNQFTSDQSLEDKLIRLRELLSNKLPSCPTQNELLHAICDIALGNLERSIKDAIKKRGQKKIATKTAAAHESRESGMDTNVNSLTRNRYISSEIKREVRQRDGDRCTYVLSNGNVCGDKMNLQFDHIVPYAKGGGTSAENLRQVCRNHNQWLAIQAYGAEKISRFIKTF